MKVVEIPSSTIVSTNYHTNGYNSITNETPLSPESDLDSPFDINDRPSLHDHENVWDIIPVKLSTKAINIPDHKSNIDANLKRLYFQILSLEEKVNESFSHEQKSKVGAAKDSLNEDIGMEYLFYCSFT